MFLEQTIKRNEKLMEVAFQLHQEGRIQPDSYVIDVDTFLANAKIILDEATKKGIRLFFMLKQVGRNPYLAKKLVELGYAGAVAVDFREVQRMMEYNIPLGNVGHLVQIPNAMLEQVVEYGAEAFTVYSKEKMLLIQRAAEKLGKKQGIFLRVCGKDDLIYSGQTAGFLLSDLSEIVTWIEENCPNLFIKGVTSFPCFLYQEASKSIEATENLNTVKKAELLLVERGYKNLVLNTPSATCVATLSLMEREGANCGEPGHGLSGSTPLHAHTLQPECPCVIYVSEVSHFFEGEAYCYGGGHYRRSHVENALVGENLIKARECTVTPPSEESIDYHFALHGPCKIGDTVVMAFRFQMFVTRSNVVLIEGLHSGEAKTVDTYDSLGRRLF